jgi:hypothetical protein
VEKEVICPGCGVTLNTDNNELDKEFNALSACRALCFEVSYYTLSLRDSYFIHQLVVDAYCAQHASSKSKPIAIPFALVGLYLVNERNGTGKDAQNAHIKLAKLNYSKQWPRFEIPKEKNWITVKDVVKVPDNKKQDMIKQWSKSVWEIWKSEKERIEELLQKYEIA